MNKIDFKDKRLLIVMTIVCVGLIILSAASQKVMPQVQDTAGYAVWPFQVSINKIGSRLVKVTDSFRSASDLAKENRELKEQVAQLNEMNGQHEQEMMELERLRELYELDSEFPDYNKVAAKVISKDPGNWYNTFVVDKGEKDNVLKDMNVIGNGGLVGIVTDTGSHWAKIRTIIDDESNVSAVVNGKQRLCMVSGSLKDINNGKINFFGLQDTEDTVVTGDLIITSNISEKFLPGLSIGYISDVYKDSNNMTKSGQLVPIADFREIREVLIITDLKETGESEEEDRP